MRYIGDRLKLILIFSSSIVYMVFWGFGLYNLWPWACWIFTHLNHCLTVELNYFLFFLAHVILLGTVGGFVLITAVCYFIVCVGKTIELIRGAK